MAARGAHRPTRRCPRSGDCRARVVDVTLASVNAPLPLRTVPSLRSRSPFLGALLLALAPAACAAPASEDVDPELLAQLDGDDVGAAALPPPELGPTPLDPCIVFPPFVPPGPGALDTSFGCRGVASHGTADADFTVRGLAVQADDKIVVVGSRYTTLLNNNDLWVARFTAGGALDTTFGTGGHFTTDLTAPLGGGEAAHAVVITPDGGIVVGGYVHREDGELRRGILLRLTPAGALDPTFGTGGMVQSTAITSVNAMRYEAGELVLAGQRCGGSPEICYASAGRFSATTGAPTTSFSATGVRNSALGGGLPANGLAVTTYAGYVVVAGSSKGSTTGTDSGVTRFDADSVDTSFGNSGSRRYDDDAYESFTGAATVPFGKFLFSGRAGTATGVDKFVLRRLTNTGSSDSTFGTYGRVYVPFDGYSAAAAAVIAVPGSKAVAVGSAKTSTGKSRAAVARLTSSGALDTTFSGDGQVMLTARNDEASATAVAVQSTGHLVVAGWSTNTSWRRRGFVARLVP